MKSNGEFCGGKPPTVERKSERLHTAVLEGIAVFFCSTAFYFLALLLPLFNIFSMVMLEQLKTVNQSDLTEYIGLIDNEQLLRKINNGLKSAFGLWTKNPRRKGEIRCLCSRCLEDYKSNPDYIVRRFDPFAKEKEKCDKCHRMGFEYIVREKQNRSFQKDEGKTDKA